MTWGISRIHFKKGTAVARKLTLEIAPTIATGTDQNMIVTTTTAIEIMLRIFRDFHEILKLDQMTELRVSNY